MANEKFKKWRQKNREKWNKYKNNHKYKQHQELITALGTMGLQIKRGRRPQKFFDNPKLQAALEKKRAYQMNYYYRHAKQQRKTKKETEKQIEMGVIKEARCNRCETLLKYDNGNGEVCAWCLKELGITQLPDTLPTPSNSGHTPSQ